MRLKELRTKQGMTQTEVAAALGVARTTYLGYERETIAIPARRLEELADAFGVTIDYISGKPERGQSDEDAAREYAKANLAGALKIVMDEMARRGLA